MFPQIRCYHGSVNQNSFTFFILSKGENSGKPGLQPWVNSFAVHCHSQQQFEFYFWLTYGLYKANHFKPMQKGTAVQYVNIKDVYVVLGQAAPAIEEHWHKYKKILEALELLEKSKTTLGQQLVSTQNMQEYLIRKFFVKYK